MQLSEKTMDLIDQGQRLLDILKKNYDAVMAAWQVPAQDMPIETVTLLQRVYEGSVKDIIDFLMANPTRVKVMILDFDDPTFNVVPAWRQSPWKASDVRSYHADDINGWSIDLETDPDGWGWTAQKPDGSLRFDFAPSLKEAQEAAERWANGH